jgi:acetyl esterase/lipase
MTSQPTEAGTSDFDPELAPLLELIPPLSLTNESLAIIRQLIAGLGAPAEKHPGRVTTTEIRIPAPGRTPVRALISRPVAAASTASPALLWMHGGGYVIGQPELNQGLAEDIAAELGCVVVSVAYRLAPDTPHPGPVEDCYIALQWIHDSADDLGVDPRRVAVGGESAGGGLAAALSLLARDRGELSICCVLLIYPMLDDRTAIREHGPHVGKYVWTAPDNAFGWRALLGQEPGSADVSCYAAAARAEDLAGLPTTVISVGALDLFLDECVDYGMRLLRAGVPAEIHVYERAFHAFLSFDAAEVSRRHFADCLAALSRAFQTPQQAGV